MPENAVNAAALSTFRGAPFDQSNITTAVESIRTQCEWHIAPVLEHTFEIDAGPRGFSIPTLHLVAITGLVDGDDPERDLLTDSRKLRVYGRGRVKLLSGPALPEFVKVTVRHGHTSFPAELLPVVAARARDAAKGRTRTESIAARSMTLDLSGEAALDALLLDKYKLHHQAGDGS
ncbi:hypothetical protein [Nesterenkonia jeotgali]|uniref:Uncharacterized protein n=1 Tax=Nesterenkonia jeotgali TaxID=317018 RepID=A0A0W8ICU9_9MICC|nr:hypothetical protein [Nesterenkonia jeotgali]KUG57780.1 hypothetical protein AVL63_04455 [Nesterenkonia jeotgali]